MEDNDDRGMWVDEALRRRDKTNQNRDTAASLCDASLGLLRLRTPIHLLAAFGRARTSTGMPIGRFVLARAWRAS